MTGRDYLVPSYDAYGAHALTVFGTDGDYVQTSAGRLLDLNGGLYWTAILGTGDAEVRRRMAEGYSADLFGVLHPPAMELARALCVRTGYARVSYSTSGSDAVDSAIRMAYQFQRAAGFAPGEKSDFVTLRNGFHGTTLATLTTAGFRRRREILPCASHTHALGRWVVDDSIASVDAAWAALATEPIEQAGSWPLVAGFVFEPVQGVAGVRAVNPYCYEVLAQRCREHGVVMIADEISTGIGRTGRFVATEAFVPRPDILVIGKGVTNGEFPLAVTLVSDAVWTALDAVSADPFEKYLYGSTYAGHPTGCLAALEVIRRMDDTLLAEIREKGDRIRGILMAFRDAHEGVCLVRGTGLMWALEFASVDEAHRIASALVVRGIRCGVEGRVITAFPSVRTDVDAAFSAFTVALDDILSAS